MTAKSRFVCVAVMLLTACGRDPASMPPPAVASSVLIVTIDTLRADRLGVYGAANVKTPNIDRLAVEGAWAPQATVHAPLTRPSHVSLFTGRYPAEHGSRDNISPPLAASVPLLAERFERAGFGRDAHVRLAASRLRLRERRRTMPRRLPSRSCRCCTTDGATCAPSATGAGSTSSRRVPSSTI